MVIDGSSGPLEDRMLLTRVRCADWLLAAAAGLSMSAASVYVAESAPAAMRGRLVVAQSVMITMGRMLGAWVSAVVFSVDPPAATRRPVWIAGLERVMKGRPGPGHLRSLVNWVEVVSFTNRRSSSRSIEFHLFFL